MKPLPQHVLDAHLLAELRWFAALAREVRFPFSFNLTFVGNSEARSAWVEFDEGVSANIEVRHRRPGAFIAPPGVALDGKMETRLHWNTMMLTPENQNTCRRVEEALKRTRGVAGPFYSVAVDWEVKGGNITPARFGRVDR